MCTSLGTPPPIAIGDARTHGIFPHTLSSPEACVEKGIPFRRPGQCCAPGCSRDYARRVPQLLLRTTNWDPLGPRLRSQLPVIGCRLACALTSRTARVAPVGNPKSSVGTRKVAFLSSIVLIATAAVAPPGKGLAHTVHRGSVTFWYTSHV